MKKITKATSFSIIFLLNLIVLVGNVPVRSAGARQQVKDAWEMEYEKLQIHLRHPDSYLWMGMKDCQERDWKFKPVQKDQAYHKAALIQPEDSAPADIVIRRTRALLDHLKSTTGSSFADLETRLQNLETKSWSTDEQEKDVFLSACALRREIAFANPLLDFSELLFVAHAYDGERHMCDQYFGFNTKKGGSLYRMSNPFSENPTVEDILEGVSVENGNKAGTTINGDGAFLSPDLDYDGKRIAFAWVDNAGRKNGAWLEENTYKIFTVNSDGSSLRQLTTGRWNEFDPCWLPNGRIAFISERRGGFGRCHGRPVPTFTLFSMKDDGNDIICLSFHETNEWHPSVDNSGQIAYTRWDYVDRDSDIAHHLWLCYLDGRDPRAPHGNYPHPISPTPDVPWYENPVGDGRKKRPWMEMNIRAIPGSATKYIATATPHHGYAHGSLVLIDIAVEDDNVMSQVKRLTPDAIFPESEGGQSHHGPYGTAWPLSEQVYLCNFLQDIYYLDAFGNKELLCTRDEALIATHGSIGNVGKAEKFYLLDPIPLRERDKPNYTPAKTYQGERDSDSIPRATISVTDIYNADMPWPEGVEIKYMRIVQLIPKATQKANKPNMGYANQGIGRIPLGVVPVHEDGSVYCEAPVGKAIYFQALDENYMAVHSMRSVTYVHPSENLSCAGCHEDRWQAVPPPPNPIAYQSSPATLEPELGAMEPATYHRLVKDVFMETCLPCHQEKDKGIQDFSYPALQPYAHYYDGGGNGHINRREIGGSRTIPGYYGAAHSKMGKKLLESHKERITREEFHRVVMWLDLMSNEFVTSKYTDREAEGELVWPSLDVDPENLSGVEYHKLMPGQVATLRDIGGNAANHVAPSILSTPKGVIVRNSSDSRAVLTFLTLSGRTVQTVELAPLEQKTLNRRAMGMPAGTFILRFQVNGLIRAEKVSFLPIAR